MKRGLVPLLTLVLAPAVLAQEQGIFDSAFSLIFGSVSGSPANDMVLKVGLWLALTMVLFQGAQKIFKTKDATGQEVGYKKLSIIFALIISTIAVRFMPPFISEGLGAMTWIAALILLPYTLVGFVTDNKWARIITTGIFVIITWALFSSYSAPFVFPYIRGNNFLSDLYYMMTPQAWLIPVIALGVILILFFIFKAKDNTPDNTPSGGGGGSRSSGLFGKALGGLGKVIAAPFKALGHGISGLGKGIGYAGLGLGKGIGGAAHGVGKLAGGAIGGIGKGIGAAVPHVGKGIGVAVSGIGHGIGAGVKGVGELGGAALGKGVPAAGRVLGKFGSWLKNKFKRKSTPTPPPLPPPTPYGTPLSKAPPHTKIKRSYFAILGMMRKDEKRLKEITKGGIPAFGTKEFTKYARVNSALNKHRKDLSTMTPPPSGPKPVPTRLLYSPTSPSLGRKTGPDVDLKILTWQSRLKTTTDPRRIKRLNDVIAKLQQVRKHRP